MKDHTTCPCGTGKTYLDCCGVFISNQKNPSTPEELMRSRYTAYTQANIDYIAQTMKSPASDNFDTEAAREWAKKINWAGLKVTKTALHPTDPTKGIVEFYAYYSINNKEHEIHEISEFSCENNKWYYIDREKS